MQKKILLAVDNTRPSKNAIRYAVHVSAFVKKLYYVLFHVQPMISLILQEEAHKSVQAKKQLDKVLGQNDQFARKLIEDYRDEMEKMGIAHDRIEVVTQRRNLGFAKDILEFGQKRGYDAIVVGRRGLSRLAEMYAGSVTSNILEQSQVIPVWLVDGDITSTEILVAVDGSEDSLRAIDHVSFMISNNPDIHLTLLHVTSNARNYCEINPDEDPDPQLEEIVARGDKVCIEQFFPHAIQKFKAAGISEDQIEMKTIKGGRRAGKAILDFVQKGDYGTVVIGRRGIDKAFFMGSVSRFIINRISNCCLWIVP